MGLAVPPAGLNGVTQADKVRMALEMVVCKVRLMYVCMYVCMCLSVCMFLVQNSSTSVETCSNTPGYSVPTVPDSNNVRAVILNNKGGR